MVTNIPKDQKFDIVVLTYVLTGTSSMSQTFKNTLEYVKPWWRIAILDSYGFFDSVCSKVFHTLFRCERKGVGFRDSVYDVFYSQRNHFSIDITERIISYNHQRNDFYKEYLLIWIKK